MAVCGTVRLEKGPREEAAERKEPGNLFDHHRSPKYPSTFKFFKHSDPGKNVYSKVNSNCDERVGHVVQNSGSHGA